MGDIQAGGVNHSHRTPSGGKQLVLESSPHCAREGSVPSVVVICSMVSNQCAFNYRYQSGFQDCGFADKLTSFSRIRLQELAQEATSTAAVPCLCKINIGPESPRAAPVLANRLPGHVSWQDMVKRVECGNAVLLRQSKDLPEEEEGVECSVTHVDRFFS